MWFAATGEALPCPDDAEFAGFAKSNLLCEGPTVTATPAGHTVTVQVAPHDPNFISGPAGFGPQNFVTPGDTLPYVIDFENQATAGAPAQQVIVTQQLDPNLDWTTFQLGDFGFGDTTISVPAGRTSYSTRLDERATLGIFVDVSAGLDLTTGLATWRFTAIDPQTLDIPDDPLVGFLPPDLTAPQGEGFIDYTAQPKASLATGTVIKAKATVVFDAELPDQTSLDTAPFTNTIDAGAPTSSVAALPTFSPGSFAVNWGGTDDAGGSGIASYNVYASDNGGAFTLLLGNITQTSTTYTGQPGHTYGFYSVATDNVGNVQATPTAAQAGTTVQYGTGTQLTSSAPNNTAPQGQAVTFAAAVSNAVVGGPTPTGKVNFVDASSGKDLGTFALTNGQAAVTTSSLPVGQNVIVATYLADAAFLSSSGSVTETVTAGGPSDITSQVSVVKGGYRRLSSGLWVQQVTITNTSGGAIAGPVTLGLKSLKGGTLASATVNGAAAPVLSAQDGSPYIPLVASGDVFAVNQQLTVVLDFTDPYNLALSWVAQLLAGPGQR